MTLNIDAQHANTSQSFLTHLDLLFLMCNSDKRQRFRALHLEHSYMVLETKMTSDDNIAEHICFLGTISSIDLKLHIHNPYKLLC